MNIKNKYPKKLSWMELFEVIFVGTILIVIIGTGAILGMGHLIVFLSDVLWRS